MTDTAPTAKEQRRIITNLVGGQSLGTYGYVVATEWYQKWQEYVGYQREPLPNAGRPGSLAMSDSGHRDLDDSQYTHPIATMSDSVNILVDEKIWLKWVEWYGVADSHHLRRHGYSWATYSNYNYGAPNMMGSPYEVGYDQGIYIYNPQGIYHVCLLNSYSKHVKYPTKVFDKREECGYIEFQLRRMFDVPAGRKTKLWLRKDDDQQAGHYGRPGEHPPRFEMVFNRSSTISSVLPEQEVGHMYPNNDIRGEHIFALEVCQTYGPNSNLTREYAEDYFKQYLPLTGGPRHSKTWEDDLSVTVKSMCEGISQTLQETVGGVTGLREKMKQISETQKELHQKHRAVDEEEKKLKVKEEQLKTEREKVGEDRKKLQLEIQRMAEVNKISASRVKLDIGGHVYTTSTLTLTKDQDSMLAAMFSGRHSVQREEDGSYFIDRDGTHFRYILNYLRDGGFSDGALPGDRSILNELLTEARYYQLGGLVKVLQGLLSQ